MKDLELKKKIVVTQGKENYLKIRSDQEPSKLLWNDSDSTFSDDKNGKLKLSEIHEKVEPWLTALFQSERLNLLVGSGLTIAQEKISTKGKDTMMNPLSFSVFLNSLTKESKRRAKINGRKKANIEDQINAVNTLLSGLEIYVKEHSPASDDLKENVKKLNKELDENLKEFIKKVLGKEKIILDNKEKIQNYLIPFLMSFVNRTSSKERLHIFTTNYDRCIEWGADLTGLRLIDRFVGSINPIFRSSRLNIDMHYNPPGIRGEPRYLEGVAYFTKLHGSLDWRYKNGNVQKIALPFGNTNNLKITSKEQCLIYPNSAKDVQTNNYPYAELFRDFATAICRPNTTLVTYGYGFCDEHINRVINDMLTVPSTHLVIISYDDPNKAIKNFYDNTSRKEQISKLIGNELGSLENLVKYFLPKSAISQTMNRMFEVQRKRNTSQQIEDSQKNTQRTQTE